jgi:hypothetical protein
MDRNQIIFLLVIVVLTVIITILTFKFILHRYKTDEPVPAACTTDATNLSGIIISSNGGTESEAKQIKEKSQQYYSYYYPIIAIIEHHKNLNTQMNKTNVSWRNNYYKTQIVDMLKTRYTFYTFLYYVLAFCYILYYALIENDGIFRKLMVSSVILLYPVLIDQIVSLFLFIYNYLMIAFKF